MYWVDGVGGKIYFYGYYFVVVGQNVVGYVIVEVFKGGVFMKNKYWVILLLK